LISGEKTFGRRKALSQQRIPDGLKEERNVGSFPLKKWPVMEGRDYSHEKHSHEVKPANVNRCKGVSEPKSKGGGETSTDPGPRDSQQVPERFAPDNGFEGAEGG